MRRVFLAVGFLFSGLVAAYGAWPSSGRVYPNSSVSLKYIGSALTNTSSSSPSFSSQSIGTASSDRVILVAINGFASSAQTISSVTIGGVAATLIVSKENTSTFSTISAIYGLLVTSGTAATIAVNFGQSSPRTAISVYSLTGTGGVVTAHNTTTNGANSTGPLSVNVTTLQGQVLGVASGNISSGTASVSWSGPALDYNSSFSTSSAVGSAAHMTNGAASQSVSATMSGGSVGSDGFAVVAAGW